MCNQIYINNLKFQLKVDITGRALEESHKRGLRKKLRKSVLDMTQVLPISEIQSIANSLKGFILHEATNYKRPCELKSIYEINLYQSAMLNGRTVKICQKYLYLKYFIKFKIFSNNFLVP